MFLDESRKTISGTASCPSCRTESHFWSIDPPSDREGRHAIYSYPMPRSVRNKKLAESIEGDQLKQAYGDAVDTYNAGLWHPCAVACRRMLEGIVKSKLPTSKSPLGEGLVALFEMPELLEPAKALADAIRRGGNAAAHFDLDREFDRDTATVMLDPLDFFVEYVFALKAQSSEIETRIKASRKL